MGYHSALEVIPGLLNPERGSIGVLPEVMVVLYKFLEMINASKYKETETFKRLSEIGQNKQSNIFCLGEGEEKPQLTVHGIGTLLIKYLPSYLAEQRSITSYSPKGWSQFLLSLRSQLEVGVEEMFSEFITE